MSALFLGMVLALEYDCIRIFRRVIRHKNIWVMSAEDILYWIYAAVTVFCMTYEVNDGILRLCWNLETFRLKSRRRRSREKSYTTWI